MSSGSRRAGRLKNSACWYLNKIINDSVHRDHLSMFSASEYGDLPSLDAMVDTLLVRLLSHGLTSQTSRLCLFIQVFCKFVKEMIGNDSNR